MATTQSTTERSRLEACAAELDLLTAEAQAKADASTGARRRFYLEQVERFAAGAKCHRAVIREELS